MALRDDPALVSMQDTPKVRASPGRHASRHAPAQGLLACILLLDQFTRNVYRGTPRMLAGDAHALRWAHKMIRLQWDAQLAPIERAFAYLPLEHCEDAATQALSVAKFKALLEAPAASCFARRVELNSAGRTWVYAETLIPDHTLEAHPWLAELGDSSLGATLAACKDLVRGPFEFAPLPESHPLAGQALARSATRGDVVWARRSWFALAGRRLLVQEAFLPGTTQC